MYVCYAEIEIEKTIMKTTTTRERTGLVMFIVLTWLSNMYSYHYYVAELETNKQHVTVVIAGFKQCEYFQNSTQLAERVLVKKENPTKYSVSRMEFINSTYYRNWLEQEDRSDRPNNDVRAINHKTSPLIFEKETMTFIGGYDDFIFYCSKAHHDHP